MCNIFLLLFSSLLKNISSYLFGFFFSLFFVLIFIAFENHKIVIIQSQPLSTSFFIQFSAIRVFRDVVVLDIFFVYFQSNIPHTVQQTLLQFFFLLPMLQHIRLLYLLYNGFSVYNVGLFDVICLCQDYFRSSWVNTKRFVLARFLMML